MDISDIISSNPNFQTSVNIDFDFGSPEKVKALIPTESVCRFVEDLLKDVISPSTSRAKLIVGPYGTGKSHITLAVLSAMWMKDPELYAQLIGAYRESGSGFAEVLFDFVNDGPKLLPVVIAGSSSDLQHSLLVALKNALKVAGLERLMPATNFTGALECIERWRTEYPETLEKFSDLIEETPESFEQRLKGMESEAYASFVRAYPQLTSGGTFDALGDADVIKVYDQVLISLKQEGISGIYVVYDEFSKYLESNIASASVEDTKLLQDFAEKCNRSSIGQQLHILLISHKSLSNYIDNKLPKDKVDGWRGVSGRFVEQEIQSTKSQAYELISKAIVKDASRFDEWLDSSGGQGRNLLSALTARYASLDTFGSSPELVVRGCFPLHPIAAFLLPELSGKVAQNERTLFTFLCSDGDRSLRHVAMGKMGLISPDVVYDYFESLFKREYYSSPVHQTYELAAKAMAKVPNDVLATKLIKAIAAITIVGQFEKVPPTRQVIGEVYSDCGYAENEINEAFDLILGSESVVYLRQSNAFLKLKESSGINIEAEIENRAGLLRNRLEPEEILNTCCTSRALYPSRHNEEKRIVRYFDCGFISSSRLMKASAQNRLIKGDGDGFVAAVYLESPDDIDTVEQRASELSAEIPMSVFVVSRHFTDIRDVLYRYAAVKELKEGASSDDVLAEEYELALEDLSEIIKQYVDGYFRPETGMGKYFAGGRKKSKISRRRKLSDLLSNLCDAAFPYTPLITSEALNKNVLTGTAFHSRSKIIRGLCAETLEPSLGFVGNGQEMSMMRSALQMTGIIRDFDCPVVNAAEATKEAQYVLSAIESFVSSANDTCFGELYETLTSIDGKIGMKKGPIPLFLAIVLRGHKDEAIITRNGEERPLRAELLEDIDAMPDEYRLSMLDWNPEVSAYIEKLASLFSCGATRTQVAEAIRRWYVELPQLTRNSKKNHSLNEITDASLKTHLAFFKQVKRADLDSSALLFDVFPQVFGCERLDDGLVESIAKEKEYCDGFVVSATEKIAVDLKRLFGPNAHSDSSLSSVLKDWVEALPKQALTHVFSGVTNSIFVALRSSEANTKTLAARIAKAATFLRIEDWNDARFGEFIEIVERAKGEIEAIEVASNQEFSSGKLSIAFIDKDGVEQSRTFDSVECSGRARLLKNSIVANLDEIGRALSPEEKRQVLFDILKEMC